MLKKMYQVMCLVMLVVLPQLAFAANPEIKIASVTGAAGQSVKVDVTLVNNGTPAASTFTISVAYDRAKMSADPTVAIGAAATAAGKLMNPSVTATRVKVILQGGTSAIANGVLVSITFPIKADAGGSTIPLTFLTPPDVVDANGDPIAITATPGSITVPAAPATVTTFTIPTNVESLDKSIPITTFTASSNATGYIITQSATAPLATDPKWSTTVPTSFIASAYGSQTLYAWVKNVTDTVSTTSKSATTTLTEPAATVTAFVVPATVYSKDIPITTFTTSVNATAYLITTTATKPAASAITATTKPTTFTVSSIGSYTLYPWVKNVSGVVSAAFAGQPVTVSEKPAPILTITAPIITPPATNALTGDSSIEVKGTATKNLAAGSADVAGVTVNGEAADFNQSTGAFSKTVTLIEGSNTTKVIASDTNTTPVTAEQTITVISDTTKPTLTVTSPINGFRTKDTVTVSGTVSDANGIESLTVNGFTTPVTNGTYSFPLPLTDPEGAKEVKVEATDKAGNKESITRTIIYDVTPLTLTVTEPVDALTTKEVSVTVRGTVTGAAPNETVTVGLKNGTTTAPTNLTGTDYVGSIALTEGSNAIVVTATDLAGNTTQVTRTVTRDTLAPALAITDPIKDIQLLNATALTIKGNTDATATEVKLTFNGFDYPQTLTGVAFEQALTIPAPVAAPGSEQVLQIVVTAKDALGNTSTATRNIVNTLTPGDSNNDGAIVKLVEALQAIQYVHLNKTFTTVQMLKLDCAPLVNVGAGNYKPNPNGVVDDNDVILLLRRAAGFITW